jgi:hypothetical protein
MGGKMKKNLEHDGGEATGKALCKYPKKEFYNIM